MTGSTLPTWRTTFLAPDGTTTVMSQLGGNGNSALHTPLLTQTGTHTLLLEPLDPSTGTLDVHPVGRGEWHHHPERGGGAAQPGASGTARAPDLPRHARINGSA